VNLMRTLSLDVAVTTAFCARADCKAHAADEVGCVNRTGEEGPPEVMRTLH